MNPQTALMANAKRLIKVYIDILFVLLCLIKLNNCNYIVFGCQKKYNLLSDDNRFCEIFSL